MQWDHLTMTRDGALGKCITNERRLGREMFSSTLSDGGICNVRSERVGGNIERFYTLSSVLQVGTHIPSCLCTFS